MPRTSQEQSQERHAFLLDLFRNQPDLSRQDALESFKDRFGATINLRTFNELRDQAKKELAAGGGASARAQEPEEEAHDERAEVAAEDAGTLLKAAATPDLHAGAVPSAKKPKAKGPGARNVFVDATAEQLQFLERVVQQLQEAGAANVRIDHATDRWMVLVVDSK